MELILIIRVFTLNNLGTKSEIWINLYIILVSSQLKTKLVFKSVNFVKTEVILQIFAEI